MGDDGVYLSKPDLVSEITSDYAMVGLSLRPHLIASTLLFINGRVETEQGVTHVIAGSLEDRSKEIENSSLKSRDSH